MKLVLGLGPKFPRHGLCTAYLKSRLAPLDINIRVALKDIETLVPQLTILHGVYQSV